MHIIDWSYHFIIEIIIFKGFLINKDIKIIYFELEDPSLSYP